MFYGVTYDMKVTHNQVKIFNVSGNGQEQTVKVKFKAENGKKVYLNNKVVDNATSENGYITVTIPFKECTVEIK
jgi:heme-binding NEAT domain protein